MLDSIFLGIQVPVDPLRLFRPVYMSHLKWSTCCLTQSYPHAWVRRFNAFSGNREWRPQSLQAGQPLPLQREERPATLGMLESVCREGLLEVAPVQRVAYFSSGTMQRTLDALPFKVSSLVAHGRHIIDMEQTGFDWANPDVNFLRLGLRRDFLLATGAPEELGYIFLDPDNPDIFGCLIKDSTQCALITWIEEDSNGRSD
jgi:hypothetical protein